MEKKNNVNSQIKELVKINVDFISEKHGISFEDAKLFPEVLSSQICGLVNGYLAQKDKEISELVEVLEMIEERTVDKWAEDTSKSALNKHKN